MRSTVNINNSLDSELRKLASKLGATYKDILNRVISAGLPIVQDDIQGSKKRFKVKAKDCGSFKPGIDVLHLNRLFDELED